MATFPTTGKLLFPGFAEQREPAALRTDTENGPPKQLMVRSRVMVTRPVTYLFAKADYTAFVAWVRDTTNNGVDWFDWTDPVDGVTKQARIVGGDISDAKPRQGHFSHWTVTFKLETWE